MKTNNIETMIPINNTNPAKGSGIYLIISKISGKRYIGSSSNIGKRCINGHLNSLRFKKHPNQRLQNHVNQFGISDLSYFVVEYCKRPILEEREQFYIDQWHPEFNIKLVAIAVSRRNSKRSIEKAKATRKLNSLNRRNEKWLIHV